MEGGVAFVTRFVVKRKTDAGLKEVNFSVVIVVYDPFIKGGEDTEFASCDYGGTATQAVERFVTLKGEEFVDDDGWDYYGKVEMTEKKAFDGSRHATERITEMWTPEIVAAEKRLCPFTGPSKNCIGLPRVIAVRPPP
jgi:hypothetical protein